MSGVTLSQELQAIHDINGIRLDQIGTMMRQAAGASFMPADVRTTAAQAMSRWDSPAGVL